MRNETETPIRVWSWRDTPCRGGHWVAERICNNETADQWLEVFQRDEPEVFFMLSNKEPNR